MSLVREIGWCQAPYERRHPWGHPGGRFDTEEAEVAAWLRDVADAAG